MNAVPPRPTKSGPDLPFVALIAANLVPLAGVLFFQWSLGEIVILYWIENVIIGVLNVVKILTCIPQPEGGVQESGNQVPVGTSGGHAAKLFLAPFFCVHYGIFTFVHGVFVFALVGGAFSLDTIPTHSPAELLSDTFKGPTAIGIAALAVSHLISMVYHFYLRGEFRRVTLPELMAAPYGRVVVLHIAILFGAFAIMALGSPLILLLLLIVGKTFLDLQLHRRSHGRPDAA